MTGIMHEGGVIRLLGHATERISWISSGSDTFYASLSKSAYAPTATDTSYTTIAAAMEVASGGGYTTKGKTIAVVTGAGTTDTYRYIMCDSADPAAWTAATFITDGSCILDDTATNKPLVCWLDFGGDKSVTAGTLTVVFDAKGVYRVKVSF
jgi:hypothetical protein